MKKWSGGMLIILLFVILVLRYSVMDSSPAKPSPFSFFRNLTSDTLHLEHSEVAQPSQHLESIDKLLQSLVFSGKQLHDLFSQRNLSKEESQVLRTWNHLKLFINRTDLLPQTRDAVKEAVIAWQDLLDSIEQEKRSRMIDNSSLENNFQDKQCPYSLSAMNTTEVQSSGYKLQIPCGLIQDSSITIVGIPNGLLGNFQIELTGSQLPGEPDPPIILHYNVRLQGDKLTENPVIVQNTWTVAHDWGEEQRCPSLVPDDRHKGETTCWGILRTEDK